MKRDPLEEAKQIEAVVEDTVFRNEENGFTVLDLNREWWTKSLRDTYTIGGAIYFLNGAICSTNFMDAYCILFNKAVIDDYGIDGDELYSLVKSGQWTFDKMIEIADTVPTNESNSGVYRYGAANGLAILYGNGGSLTKFDEDDVPYVDAQLPKETSDIADKFSVLMGDMVEPRRDFITANAKFVENLDVTFPKEIEQYVYSYILNGSSGILIQWIRSDYECDEKAICKIAEDISYNNSAKYFGI